MSFKYLSKDNPIPREEFGPLPPEVAADRRKTADEEARRDLTKRYEQLLADAHEEITDPTRKPEENLGFSNRRLASIAARAAIALDASAAENIKLQKEVRDLTKELRDMTRRLKILTTVILCLAIISAYPSIKQIYYELARHL